MGFVPFTFIDLIDIILVAAIMYWIYRMTKGTKVTVLQRNHRKLLSTGCATMSLHTQSV